MIDWSKSDSRIVPVDIGFGDKCHAWNIYVHEITRESDVHVSMDRDAYCTPNAITAMENQLASEADAHAVVGCPGSVRRDSPLVSMVKNDR